MVSIIIAHFENKGNLEKCLKSVLAQDYSSKEIIIVNNSERDIDDYIVEDASEIKVINPGHNLFYSPAQNLGIKKSQGNLLMFLNDDVVLREDFISQLIEGFKESEDIGMVCGKILRMDKITVDTTGQFLGRDRRPIERGWQQKDEGQYNYFSYTFSPGGVAPLYRRDILEEIALDGEYFDEDFIIFYEDLDLAWRANKFGWRSFYVPSAIAYHYRGASTQCIKPRLKFLKKYYFSCMPKNLQYHLMKNRYLTILKNDSFKSILLNLPSILIYEVKLWIYVLLFRSEIVLSLIKNRNFLRKAWRKRKIINEKLKKKLYKKISH